MFGPVKYQAQLKNALGEFEAITERERKAQERSRRRMQSVDNAALQAQVDELRKQVSALFRLLEARGTFNPEEAQRLIAEMETSGEERDVVTGAKLPQVENPFCELTEPAHKRFWRLRSRPGAWVVILIILAALAVAVAFIAGWMHL